ncbi:hypothetical protein HWV62_34343 [Athelia sp. TMB]|nr:hypothetical protein HWV62_34343 [Athelia sp. TMB]
MRLTIINQTGSAILYYPLPSKSLPADLQIALLPSSATTTELQKHCATLALQPRERLRHDDGAVPAAAEARVKRGGADAFHVRVRALGGARGWGVVRTEEGGCPWRLYRVRISRGHDKLVILPRRDLSCYLADMPDGALLSSLLLPGTHETMAFHGWPISQCQSAQQPDPLLHQLQSGIRLLDLRLSIVDDRLMCFHGPVPQRTPFTSILATLYAFLSPSGPGAKETIVVSIKQEDTASPLFTKLVQGEIAASEGGDNLWYTESNRIPTLGEVRGRCVLLSRFGDPNGPNLGIHPDRWPDSQRNGFECRCGQTTVRVQDWYAIPSFLSIPEKLDVAMSFLLPPGSSHGLYTSSAPIPAPGSSSLAITFFSAASIPLALPPTIARGFGWPQWGLGVVGVNERLGARLLTVFSGPPSELKEVGKSRFFRRRKETAPEKQPLREQQREEPRLRGWAFMDFVEDRTGREIVPLLVECNFRQ